MAPGPWAKTFWDMMDLPDKINIKGKDGKFHKGIKMWTYWCLGEGTLGVNPDFAMNNQGKMPPVIHVDTDTPLYSSEDGSLITDKLWGIYYKPDFNFGGVQGGAASYIVEGDVKADPYKIWFFNGTFYLIGYCHFRGEIRIFALDRIKILHQTKNTFEVPEDFNLEEFMGSSFGVFQGEPMRIKVWFSADIAGYIKEKIWHESQEIHPQDDGSIIFETEVAGTDEIRFWVMSWGSNAVVLEPESLRDEIKAEAEAKAIQYEKGTVVEESPSYGLRPRQPLQRS